MRSLKFLSPAKLNLSLKVLGKRPDGYHQLKTIFERIDLCDEITLRANNAGQIRILSSHASLPKGPKNLMYQAAHMLKEKYAVRQGVDIRIQKRIPIAAGLGGGSSNAATVLKGLNQLWRLSVPFSQLVQYGAAVGSDVPFFLYDGSWAIGTGRGEQIKKLLIATRLWHVLVVPRLRMYTKDVFRALNLKLTNFNDDVNILLPYLRKSDVGKVGEFLSNDLETPILQLRPHLLSLKEKLKNLNTLGVCFSGSGPSIFAIVRTQQQATMIRRQLIQRYRQVFVVRTF